MMLQHLHMLASLLAWRNMNNSEAGLRTCQVLQHQASRLSLSWLLQPSLSCLTCCSMLSLDDDNNLFFLPLSSSLDQQKGKKRSSFSLLSYQGVKHSFTWRTTGQQEKSSSNLLYAGHPTTLFPLSLLQVAELQTGMGYTHPFWDFKSVSGFLSLITAFLLLRCRTVSAKRAVNPAWVCVWTVWLPSPTKNPHCLDIYAIL